MITRPEVTILDKWLAFEGDILEPFLFHLRDAMSSRWKWLLMLRELTYLPIETRSHPDVLAKQGMAVRGFSHAEVNFSYLVCGSFPPVPRELSQFYGAQAESHAAHDAVRLVTEADDASISQTLGKISL